MPTDWNVVYYFFLPPMDGWTMRTELWLILLIHHYTFQIVTAGTVILYINNQRGENHYDLHNRTSISSDVNSSPLDLSINSGLELSGEVVQLPWSFSWMLYTFPPQSFFPGIQIIQQGHVHCCPSVQLQIRRSHKSVSEHFLEGQSKYSIRRKRNMRNWKRRTKI